MNRSYILSAQRSAVVPHNGAFAPLALHELAAPVVQTALEAAQLTKAQVGELIVSNALGAGGNPARVVALGAGLPQHVAGLSVDRQCAGGLDALILADAMLRSGLHDVVIAGGVESHSRRPLRYRTFADGRDPEPFDQAMFTPWPDRDPDMAEAADLLGRKLGIDREAQDNWACDSHAKAMTHQSDLASEIVPVSGNAIDPFTRRLTPRLCARAPQVSGTITAANMAVAADGAAFVVMVSESFLHRMNLRPMAAFLGGQTVGGDPDLPGLAPVAAIDAVLRHHQVTAHDLASAEIMEAFATQTIACQRGADLPERIVNPKGGALARGHPIGASGAVLAVRLVHDLTALGPNTKGLAAIAAAGGLGTAVLLENLQD